MELLLRDLLARELVCAPHVVARLAARLAADPPSVVEVAERLTPDQRLGRRALPSPLPLTPAVERAFAELELSERDRTLLLAQTLRSGDDLGTLVAFDGRSARELAASPVGALLVIHAGRVRLSDPRLSVWIQALSTSARTAEVHSRLAGLHAALGDEDAAAWHRARASLTGDPAAARTLVGAARRLLGAGREERALALAREAAAHVSGRRRDGAMLLAGLAAVGAGLAGDAVHDLGSLYPRASARLRGRALGGLLVAQTFVLGAVPDVDPALFRPRSAKGRAAWRDWTRAAGLAALLCAERGDRAPMRLWLDAVREGAAVVGAETGLREPVVALCWLLAGDSEVGDGEGEGPLCGTLLRALRLAARGDIEQGLRLLRDDSPLADLEPDHLVPGLERSPLVRAYRAVAETLLLVWRGDIGAARERLLRAAVELPVALPFAGLGVVLARRLDLAVRGEIGPVAHALTAVLPVGGGVDGLVDSGIEAFLAGAVDAAGAAVELWRDGGAPEPVLGVPGLEEVAVAAQVQRAASGPVTPPDLAVARDLRVRLLAASAGSWPSERDDVRETARTLRSPFARARVELVLGLQHAVRDDHLAARMHLQRAERLFEAAGADAWARAARDRIDRLDTTAAQLVPAPERLSVCRSVWRRRLTARELDVAMLAVRGAGNREIGRELSVSVRTVEVHLGRVFAKLEVRNRVELTALAHRTERHL
ncbi:helix-turn-helix transcriptional regulator [Microbacterium sp. SSW1-47]|uniref:LuxR C-terminal-related transcriptional regulator n=1 Tax=Microbacterium TaxID=33882 RepID=UPI001FFD26DC|nr:helix-turn-helix transcriptional regulator [Microbacterium sufflavum]MCK2027101.1 helix-turn-helix transcriptional regulator [Microbacterium sufflavum]